MELIGDAELRSDGVVGVGITYKITTVLSGSPSDLARVPFVVPAMRDSSARCRGYRESLATKPWSSVRHVLELNRRHGIVEIRDTGNTWEALRYLVDLLEVDWVERCGPVLVEGEPAHEVERPVAGKGGARLAVESAVLEGATWLMLGNTISPQIAQTIVSYANEYGLMVGARPGCSTAEELVGAGVDVVYGALSCFADSRGAEIDLTAEAIAWSDRDPSVEASRIGEHLAENDTPLVTEYIAARRKVLLEEAVLARGLEELVPIFPAMRYLLEMRKAGGQRIGRQMMSDMGAMQKLGREGRARAREGLDRLGVALSLLQHGGVRIIPGSAAPSIGVVPGLGFWEELSALSSAGCDPVELMREATAESGGEGIRLALGADPRIDAQAAFAVVAPISLSLLDE